MCVKANFADLAGRGPGRGSTRPFSRRLALPSFVPSFKSSLGTIWHSLACHLRQRRSCGDGPVCALVNTSRGIGLLMQLSQEGFQREWETQAALQNEWTQV